MALLGGTGQVAIMQGVSTASNHAIRVHCHQELFRQFAGIQVVALPSDQDDIARAEREAIAVMKAHPKLRGWVASDASGPIGIGRAIAALGAQGYWSVLQLWQQGLGASAIERIDTGISVIGPGSGSCSSSGNP